MSEILEPIQSATGPNLLVGFDTADDAGVYLIDDERAIVSTADFITPVVDDPRTFGRIAAANSISDVYAMGGTPIMALNLLGYPPVGLPNQVLGEILAGSGEICAEAGFGFMTQLPDGVFAQFVAQSLCRPGYVTINFCGDFVD